MIRLETSLFFIFLKVLTCSGRQLIELDLNSYFNLISAQFFQASEICFLPEILRLSICTIQGSAKDLGKAYMQILRMQLSALVLSTVLRDLGSNHL